MAGRKQAVKNAVPKPGHNYFLSHCQDRAIDEAESVSGCCAQGSAVIPWVQRWQANIALLSCSRAGRASAPVVNCFLSHADRSKKSVVAGYPPLTRFRCSEPKGKVETPNKQQNQSVHKRCSIFLDACQTGHFPNPVTETPLRTTVQQTNPERGVFVNGKCFSTLGREDHSTAIRQTITILSLHKQKYNRRRRRIEENEEDVLSWPASQGHRWKCSAFLNET